MLTVTYAECHIKAPYAEYHYAECRYAECRHAECRGAVFFTKKDKIGKKNWL
jgi:hypothetical protein